MMSNTQAQNVDTAPKNNVNVTLENLKSDEQTLLARHEKGAAMIEKAKGERRPYELLEQFFYPLLAKYQITVDNRRNAQNDVDGAVA